MHLNKRWLLLGHFGLLSMLAAQAQWTAITSPTPANLWKMAFFDNNVGYINSNSTLLRTTDGGETWSQTTQMGSVDGGFSIVSNSVGYLGGFYDLIKKTVDQGVTWTSISIGNQSLPVYSVSFPDASTGFALGTHGKYWKTINGGGSWTAYQIPNLPDLRVIHFVDANRGIAFGNSGTIRRTSNGGASWQGTVLSGQANISDFFFLDANTGFLVGTQGKMWKTTNGGTNWSEIATGTTENLSAVCFRNAQEGYVGGAGGFMMKTMNGGITWTTEDNPSFLSGQQITDIVFHNDHYYAIGHGGHITRSGPVSGIPSLEESSPNIVIAPNPASTSFTVHIDNGHRSGQIRLYNSLGALVRTYDLETGNTEIAVGDVADGLYVVEVNDRLSIYRGKLLVQH